MSHQKGADSRSKASRNLVRIVAQREGVSRVFSEGGKRSAFLVSRFSFLLASRARYLRLETRNEKQETRNVYFLSLVSASEILSLRS